MSHSELMGWYEYYGMSPFAEDKNEIQMAMLSSIVSTAAGGKLKMNDFMVTKTQDSSRSSLTVEEMSAEEIDKMAGVNNG